MKHVLIVDDDSDYLFQTSLYLENAGYKTSTVNSVSEATHWLKNNIPDLAILDLMMEENDSGFVLARKIKKQFPDIPVIISTSVANETGMNFEIDENSSTWIKADKFISKSIRGKQLINEIKQYI